MENEVLNSVKLIMRNLYEDMQNEIGKLEDDKVEIEKQIEELSVQKNDQEYFSFFDRVLFKRKKYQEYLDNVKRYNQEYSNKKLEMKSKINSIDSLIYEEQKKVDKLKKLIENPSMIELSMIYDYFKDYQEIEVYCNSKNIELTDTSKLYLGKNENDEVFMNNAISNDFRLIVFDNSYSLTLYKQVINQLNEFVKNNFGELDYRSNINLYDELTSGKYDNHFIKHVMDYIKYVCGKGKTIDDMKVIINKYYLGLAQKLDKLYQKYKKENYGDVLEKLYETDNYVVGCHATSYKPEGDLVQDDNIFEEGLRESNRGNSKSMQFTVAYDIPFLEVLDYDQNRYGNVSGGYVYILTIPKDVIMQKEPLWGIGEDGNNYILPKFIYGKYKQTSDNPELIINNNANKKEYDNRELDRSK